MTFGEHVFLCCERGTDTALLAEPINAASNAAFLLAGWVGLQLVLWRPPEERNADLFLLPVLVLFIGFGSLAFHLYADRGTALADVVPIAVFMLVYLGFALNRFLRVPPGFSVLAVIGFMAMMALTSQVQCTGGAVGFLGEAADGAKPCLNGSVFYLPALIALIVVGLLLREREHKAAPWLLWAAAIFAVSLTLRSLDLALCDKVLIDGRKVGTHFAWHTLNALALFLLLRASLVTAPQSVGVTETEPVPQEPQPVEAERVQPTPGVGDLRPATAVEKTLAEGLAPPPKKLPERVASVDEDAAKDEEAAEDAPASKVLSPA
jgi:Ceramidase